LTKKEKSPIKEGTVKTETMLIVALVALCVGFLAGIAFGIYKSEPVRTTDISGQTDSRAREMDEQISALLDEASAHPENVGIWIQLGNLYFDSDQAGKAVGAYEKALALNPENADVWTDLGVMYRRDKKPAKALEAFNRAMAENPRHEVSRFNKGIVLMHDLSDPEGAVRVWEELLEINPVAMAPNGQSVDELVNHFKDHPND
jgi:cytochrome c-type biogenesis protein CcmH/NrfG